MATRRDTAAVREHLPIEQRRAQLLTAAAEVMREQGVAAATTRAIAERAGVPHGSVHYCFGTKTALVRALLQSEVDRSVESARHRSSRSTDLEGVLRNVLEAQLESVRTDPGHHAMLDELIALARRDPALADLPGWEHERYVGAAAERIAEWSAASGVALARPAREVATTIMVLASGLSDLWSATGDRAVLDRALDDCVRALAARLSEPA
ncbi:TetR/AcrR family transcriptional regulator [Nocardiopsis tropica]|uniref:TetR/AcrR family transcriptional regulator n=1 Tax=Nocardiopsis tropica TaxID=109330 RepID=UPI0031DFC8E4